MWAYEPMIAALVVYRLARPEPPPPAVEASAMDLLYERYAEGRIGREEYLLRKCELIGPDA